MSQTCRIQDGGGSVIIASIPAYIASFFNVVELKGTAFARAKRFLSFVCYYVLRATRWGFYNTHPFVKFLAMCKNWLLE